MPGSRITKNMGSDLDSGTLPDIVWKKNQGSERNIYGQNAASWREAWAGFYWDHESERANSAGDHWESRSQEKSGTIGNLYLLARNTSLCYREIGVIIHMSGSAVRKSIVRLESDPATYKQARSIAHSIHCLIVKTWPHVLS